MFEKLKVIELASVLAGPSVGQFFAELGAEVIKVENPKTNGDVTRSWHFKGEKVSGTISSYFSSVNWGKKSVLLDLSEGENLTILHELVRTADMVIASYKPGDAEKLGVDYRSLSKLNPGIIYGHITGYGVNDDRVGYDAVIQAESGFMSINGEKGGGPLKMPVALMDVLAAHHLKEGMLLALIQRMSTGKGAYVPVSLIDAAVSSLANQAANWLVGGTVPGRKGNEHPNIAPYGDVFVTADEQEVILAVGNDRQFTQLCNCLGLNLTGEPCFASNSKRVENRQELNKLLAEKIKALQSGELLKTLNKSRVPVGLVRSIDKVFEQNRDNWLFSQGNLKGVRNLMAMPEGIPSRALFAPPELGEHTEELVKRKRPAGE